MKSKWTVKVSEGDIYGVPLPDGGYGRVVVARKDRGGGVWGYFFGPRYDSVPTLSVPCSLKADDAALRLEFGDLGIQEKSWPLLGRIEPWDKSQWPLPEFAIIPNEERGIAYIKSYPNGNISKRPLIRQCTLEEARRHPRSMLAGCDAAADLLAMKLRGEKLFWEEGFKKAKSRDESEKK